MASGIARAREGAGSGAEPRQRLDEPGQRIVGRLPPGFAGLAPIGEAARPAESGFAGGPPNLEAGASVPRPRPLRGPILALHSTSDVVSVALLRDGEVVGETRIAGGRAGILLAAEIERLLAESGARLGAIERIAVATGPGSFTGIKVGLATAYGLSRSIGAGIAGIGSLEVLAAQAEPSLDVAALLPAGRGELYVARFGPESSGRRPTLLEPSLATATEAAERIASAQSVVHLGCPLPHRAIREADPSRLAADLGKLAALADALPAGDVPSPVYLRRTWAEEVRDKKLLAR